MKEKLLIPEAPLQTLPTLAMKLGIKEGMILQQLHYRLLDSPYKIDGHTWYRHTYANWQKQFPFYSEKTISRAFLNLEKDNIIISSQEYNPAKVMKTKWYRIDYEELYRILGIHYDSITQTIISFKPKLNQFAENPDCEEVADDVAKNQDGQPRPTNELKESSVEEATVHSLPPRSIESQNDCTKNSKNSPIVSQFVFHMEDKEVPSIKEEFKEELKEEKNKRSLVEKDLDVVAEVIHYLNQKTNRNYRVNNHSTRRFVNARLRDGYTLEDFKKVIDLKVKQWLHDPRMKAFLRPNTLFNPTNFENYLNEMPETPSEPTQRIIQPIVLDYSAGEDE